MIRCVIILAIAFFFTLPSFSQDSTENHWTISFGNSDSELGRTQIVAAENVINSSTTWNKIQGTFLIADLVNQNWKSLKNGSLELYKENPWLQDKGQIVFFDGSRAFINCYNEAYAYNDSLGRREYIYLSDFASEYKPISIPWPAYYKHPLAIFKELQDTSFTNRYFGILFNTSEVLSLSSEATKSLALELGAKLHGNWLIVDGVPLTNDLEAVIEYWRETNNMPSAYYDNYRNDPPNSKNKPRKYIGFEVMKDAKILLASKGQTAYYIYSYKGYYLGKLETDPNAAYSFFDDGSYMSMVTNDEKQRYEASYHPNTFALWVNDDKVRIRDKPGTDGAIVTQVDKGTLLYYRNESRNRMQIGGVTAEWQKIMTEDGKEGWIFGAFVQWDPIRK